MRRGGPSPAASCASAIGPGYRAARDATPSPTSTSRPAPHARRDGHPVRSSPAPASSARSSQSSIDHSTTNSRLMPSTKCGGPVPSSPWAVVARDCELLGSNPDADLRRDVRWRVVTDDRQQRRDLRREKPLGQRRVVRHPCERELEGDERVAEFSACRATPAGCGGNCAVGGRCSPRSLRVRRRPTATLRTPNSAVIGIVPTPRIGGRPDATDRADSRVLDG
jgi:hypothetical protein